jgi:hypothetical protein
MSSVDNFHFFLVRWQQNLIGVIMLDIEYQSEDEMEPQVFLLVF